MDNNMPSTSSSSNDEKSDEDYVIGWRSQDPYVSNLESSGTSVGRKKVPSPQPPTLIHYVSSTNPNAPNILCFLWCSLSLPASLANPSNQTKTTSRRCGSCSKLPDLEAAD
uniref:Uncharacterized protein n=1 Tax=Leersia perrieri TaxID=77586 RepID=A0A0D9VG22_9ORYZ